MCDLCARAGLKLRDDGYSKAQAMDILWSETAFPVGDGATILRQVKRILSVPRRRRSSWFRRQHRRADRDMARWADAQ